MNNFIICRHCKSSMEGLDHERKLDDDGINQSNSLSNVFTYADVTFTDFQMFSRTQKSLSLTFLLKNCALYHVLITLTKLLSDASISQARRLLFCSTHAVDVSDAQHLPARSWTASRARVDAYSHLHDITQYRTHTTAARCIISFVPQPAAFGRATGSPA